MTTLSCSYTPNRTTEEELVQILDDAGLNWRRNPLGLNGETATYSFISSSIPLLDPSNEVIIFAGGEHTGGMIIPIVQTPFETVLEDYGHPDAVVAESRNVEYVLVYSKLGIAFRIDTLHPTFVYTVDIRQLEWNIGWFLDNPSFSPIVPCSDSTQVCSVPTATPNP